MRQSKSAKPHRYVPLLIRAAFIGTLGLPHTSLAAEDTWLFKSDMPTPRTWVSGCILDGMVFVIGGSPTQSFSTSTVEMYDPAADQWTRMADMPSGRSAHATCTLGGKIYVFGGIDGDVYSSATQSVFVYDPQTNTWSQKADMPYANAFCGIAVIDGTIYLMGGSASISSPPTSAVVAYDPLTDDWTQKADMPTARLLLSASVVDGKIYAVGGSTEDWTVFCYNHVELYDPSTNTWTRKADMPTARTSLGSCVVDGRIYAIGGYLPTRACTTNELYDPITDTWITKSSMQQKRLGHFVGAIGDVIYAIGGSHPNPQPTHLAVVEQYDTGLGVPLPDLNHDEIVNFADFCMLAPYWRLSQSPVDVGPRPFGDDIIDVEDLDVLAEYWLVEILPEELAAYWKLDEAEGGIARDCVGEYDGVVYGDAQWQSGTGMVAGALSFDGEDDYVETPFILNPADGPCSVLAWVKTDTPAKTIISQTGTSGKKWLAVDSEGRLMTELQGTGRGAAPLPPGTVITDNQWHQVGFTWDGTYRTLYVDDIEVSKDGSPQAVVGATGDLHIGADRDFTSESFFSGLMDDIRIYNRAVEP